MRVHVVSDVHGRVDALARAGDGADALICLGDLILFVDYDDHSVGIFADLFGAANAEKLVELRTARRFDEARELSHQLWAGVDGDRQTVIQNAVRAQYKAMFDVLPTPTYMTYGNVDVPHLYDEFARPGIYILDGKTTEIGGRTVGFVGGGLPSPYRTPFEIQPEEYAKKVQAIGAVEVLCCHIPPALPDLLYDTLGRRLERGSEALLDAIRDTQPELVLFGHVHNPLGRRVRIGRSECVNVGHFRGTGIPYSAEW